MCRDFAHRAVSVYEHSGALLLEYLGDIGVPVDPNPMDFSAWFN